MKKFFIFSLIAFFIFFVGVLLMLCILYFKKELALVRIGVRSDIMSAPVELAEVKNFFKKNWLNVELKKYGSGKLAMEGLFRGEVDIAVAANVPVVIAALERDDFSVFGTIAETRKGIRIVARKDAQIVDLADLRGKRIGVQKGTAMHYFLSNLLLYNRIPESDVKIFFLSPEETVKSLVDGKVDALCIRNPYILEAKQKLVGNVVEFYEPRAYLETYNLIAKNEYIKNNQEVLSGVLRSLLQAGDFLVNDVLEAKKNIADKFYSGDIEMVNKEWGDYKFGLFLNQSLITSLENEARWWFGYGEMRDVSSMPNFLNYIYKDLLLKINPLDVTIIR